METMLSDEERKLYESCIDQDDWYVVSTGREFTAKDIERYFVVRNFIDHACYNVVLGLFMAFRDSGIPDSVLEYAEIHHLGEILDDNHSDTMDRLWALKLSDFNDAKRPLKIYFPCRLLFKRRVEIRDWFINEKTQIERFKEEWV